jgi:hypothetical protein
LAEFVVAAEPVGIVRAANRALGACRFAGLRLGDRAGLVIGRAWAGGRRVRFSGRSRVGREPFAEFVALAVLVALVRVADLGGFAGALVGDRAGAVVGRA